VDPETDASQSPTANQPSRASLPARIARFVAGHPAGVLQGLFVALLAIVVLQNLEPTSIDVLFWSVASLPKLVLILGAMLAGGALWEIARRLLTRRST
jgi:uncharacterized integral membrane protein